MRNAIACAAILISLTASAQENERFLPLQVSVTAAGAACKEFNVALYQGNQLVAELPPSKHSAFELVLDANDRFSVRIGKPGYRDKTIAVDSRMPEGDAIIEAVAYTVDLEPMDRFAHADPFYLDFPCAIVQWDEASARFNHSERYLADIQLKMALLSAQASAE